MKFRKKRPSAEPWTHIGTGVHLDRPQTLIKLGFADSARKGHCWCFGTTRVGKTRIMEHIIEQDIRKKYSVVAIGREPYFFGVAYEVSLVVVQALIILAEVGHIAELVHLWRAQPGEGCEPLTQPRAMISASSVRKKASSMPWGSILWPRASPLPASPGSRSWSARRRSCGPSNSITSCPRGCWGKP